MSFGFWLVTASATVAGFLGYRKLQELERIIRREVQGEPAGGARRDTEGSPPPASKVEGPQETILKRVVEQPGILQTDLYREFPDETRRELQRLLREMAQAGKLERVKEGGTYRLYPA